MDVQKGTLLTVGGCEMRCGTTYGMIDSIQRSADCDLSEKSQK